MEFRREKIAVAWLSVISNTLLVLAKCAVGIAIGSVAIISEAIHSAVDLLAAFIALFAVRTSDKPADGDHPFGHGKVENISGAVEALLIFVAAGWIIYEAVHKLRHPGEEIFAAGWGVLVMFISSVVNIIVSQRLFSVGKRTDSIALQADGWHLRTDVYTSAGVMLGLAVIWLGGHLFTGIDLLWVDPLAAIIVALLIIKAAWRLTRDATRDLLDAGLPPEEEGWLRDYLARERPSVRGFHHLHTRKAGSVRFIEFHLLVDEEMSVKDSHGISEVMDGEIAEQFPGARVTVHIEPCDGLCDPLCRAGCLCASIQRDGSQRKADDTVNVPDVQWASRGSDSARP